MAAAAEEENTCPECGVEFNSTNYRKVEDDCGHVKCRNCLVQSINGCELCKSNSEVHNQSESTAQLTLQMRRESPRLCVNNDVASNNTSNSRIIPTSSLTVVSNGEHNAMPPPPPEKEGDDDDDEDDPDYAEGEGDDGELDADLGADADAPSTSPDDAVSIEKAVADAYVVDDAEPTTTSSANVLSDNEVENDSSNPIGTASEIEGFEKEAIQILEEQVEEPIHDEEVEEQAFHSIVTNSYQQV